MNKFVKSIRRILYIIFPERSSGCSFLLCIYDTIEIRYHRNISHRGTETQLWNMGSNTIYLINTSDTVRSGMVSEVDHRQHNGWQGRDGG